MIPRLRIQTELVRGMVCAQLWPLSLMREETIVDETGVPRRYATRLPAQEGFALWTILPSREATITKSLDTLIYAVAQLERRYHYQLSPLAPGAMRREPSPFHCVRVASWVHAVCIAHLLARLGQAQAPHVGLTPVAADAATADRLHYLLNDVILRRAVKLLRLAAAPVSHEAASALALAQKHISDHGITQDLLEQALATEQTSPCPPKAVALSLTAAVELLDALGEKRRRLRWSSALAELYAIFRHAEEVYDITRYEDAEAKDRAAEGYQQAQQAFLRVIAERWIRGYAVQDDEHVLTAGQANHTRYEVRRLLRDVCRKELQLHLPIGPAVEQCIERRADALRAVAIQRQRRLFDGWFASARKVR